MGKKEKKLSTYILWLLLSGMALVLIPKRDVESVFRYIRYDPASFLRHLPNFLRLRQRELLLSTLFVLAILIAIASLIGLFKHLRENDMGAEDMGKDMISGRTSGGQPAPYMPAEGSERYLRQLDLFLKDGIITREEYLNLKKRFK